MRTQISKAGSPTPGKSEVFRGKAPLAPSVAAVPASRIREIADIAFSMEGVLKLYFGESDQPTPDYIKEAATRALADGYTFYTENAGLPSLRKALADKYRELHDVELDPGTEIVITSSGVQALNVGIRCALDPGDEALLLTPAWPNGSAIVQMFNARPRQVPMALRGSRYEIDFDRLRSCLTPRTRLLLYTSPSNPLGWVASRQDQEALLEFCRRHRLWLLADEVYERLYYAGRVAPSILRLCDRDDALVVVQSFSKTYCMTGWRLGWLVTRRDAARKAAELNEFVISHAPAMAQKAGEVALRKGSRSWSLCGNGCETTWIFAARPWRRFLASGFPNRWEPSICFPGSRGCPTPLTSAAGFCFGCESGSLPEWPLGPEGRDRCASAMRPTGAYCRKPWRG